MFKTVGKHVSPPPGVDSPLLWGTEERLGELFGPDVEWTHERRTFTFRFASAQAFVDTFGEYYGPTVKALEAAGHESRGARARPARPRGRVEPARAARPGRRPRRVPRIGGHAPLRQSRYATTSSRAAASTASISSTAMSLTVSSTIIAAIRSAASR